MPLIAELKDLFGAIPRSVWAGAGSAAFTLFTINLTEKRNIRRTRDQRIYDSEEKARDRTMTLRRDVFLPVMAEFNSALAFLSAMPSYTIEEIGKAEPLKQFSVVAAKFGLIASPHAALAVQKLSADCGLLYMKFGPRAAELAAIQHSVEVHDGLLENDVKEMGRIAAAMVALHESGTIDEGRFAALVRQGEITQSQFDRQSLQRDAVEERRRNLRQQYAREFLLELRPVLDTGVLATLAMRQDLGQDDVGDELMRELKANADRIFSCSEEALSIQDSPLSEGSSEGIAPTDKLNRHDNCRHS